MKSYHIRRSAPAQELWEKMQEFLGTTILSKIGFNVKFRLFEWSIGSIVATVAVCKDVGEWTESEQIALTEFLVGDSVVGIRVTQHMLFQSVTRITPGKPNSVNYQFRMLCSGSAAESVANICENLISVTTEEVFLDLIGKRMHSYFPGERPLCQKFIGI